MKVPFFLLGLFFAIVAVAEVPQYGGIVLPWPLSPLAALFPVPYPFAKFVFWGAAYMAVMLLGFLYHRGVGSVLALILLMCVASLALAGYHPLPNELAFMERDAWGVFVSSGIFLGLLGNVRT